MNSRTSICFRKFSDRVDQQRVVLRFGEPAGSNNHRPRPQRSYCGSIGSRAASRDGFDIDRIGHDGDVLAAHAEGVDQIVRHALRRRDDQVGRGIAAFASPD